MQMLNTMKSHIEANWILILVAAAVVVGITSLIYVGFRIRHNDAMAERADSFARAFIQNNRAVRRELGPVTDIKQIGEQYHKGKRPGWYLDYDVEGSHSDGRIDMRLLPTQNYTSWSVALANLSSGNKSISLQ